MNSVIGVTRADIVIVGGGVTGLSLAFELARLGRCARHCACCSAMD
jgi:glycine/D-amino acid oxidase-like deaminating enzyme